MEFKTYLQQKIQDEDWIWEVTEKYGLNEHYPRYFIQRSKFENGRIGHDAYKPSVFVYAMVFERYLTKETRNHRIIIFTIFIDD